MGKAEEKIPKIDGRRKKGPRSAAFAAQMGKGRPKGRANQLTIDIRKMIGTALNRAGGEDYLLEQAYENPVAFMGLVGKILPKEVDANITGGVVINWGLPKCRLDE